MAISKHLVLHNWIALSLIREAHTHAAAIASSRFSEKSTRVYYAKNNLNSSDEVHAQEFTELVQLGEFIQMSIGEFQKQYFALMHKNRLTKLKHCVNYLRHFMDNLSQTETIISSILPIKEINFVHYDKTLLMRT